MRFVIVNQGHLPFKQFIVSILHGHDAQCSDEKVIQDIATKR